MANSVVESGIVTNGDYTPVLPLSTTSKKVALLKVSPFISDEVLVDTLSRYDKLVSPMKKIAIASKSPRLKRIVSSRRSVFIILKNYELV